MAGYVNHRVNSVYNVSLLVLPFLFLPSYPLLEQTRVIFQPLWASDSRNSRGYSSLHTLLCSVCIVNKNAQRSRPDNLSSWIFEVRISEVPLYYNITTCYHRNKGEVENNSILQYTCHDEQSMNTLNLFSLATLREALFPNLEERNSRKLRFLV